MLSSKIFGKFWHLLLHGSTNWKEIRKYHFNSVNIKLINIWRKCLFQTQLQDCSTTYERFLQPVQLFKVVMIKLAILRNNQLLLEQYQKWHILFHAHLLDLPESKYHVNCSSTLRKPHWCFWVG